MSEQRNEAAERLRRYLGRGLMGDFAYGPSVPTVTVLDDALAAERQRGWMLGFAEAEPQHRRATVDRIWKAVEKSERWNSDQTASYVMIGPLRAILDEEAAR